MSQDDGDNDSAEPLTKLARRGDDSSPPRSTSPVSNGSLSLGLRLTNSDGKIPILPAPQKTLKSQAPTSPGGQPSLTPIPSDLTVNAQQELREFNFFIWLIKIFSLKFQID